MRLGMCADPTAFAAAAAAGFEYVEFSVWQLPLEDDAAYAQLREQVRLSPIPVETANCFVIKRKVVGPEVDWAELRVYMEMVLQRLAALGVTTMVYGSGGARTCPDGFPMARAREQFRDSIRLAADIADRHEITLVLEPLNARECNLLNRVSEGASLVEEITHPRVKLLADQYHMASIEEPWSAIPAAARQLRHLHVDMPDLADVTRGSAADIREFIAAAKQAGYAGRISVENHTFSPREGEPVTAYYASVHDYLMALL